MGTLTDQTGALLPDDLTAIVSRSPDDADAWAILEDAAAFETDPIVTAARLEAERCRRIIEREEARLDRLELLAFRRLSFLHRSVKET